MHYYSTIGFHIAQNYFKLTIECVELKCENDGGHHPHFYDNFHFEATVDNAPPRKMQQFNLK